MSRDEILSNLFKSAFMNELLNTITGGHQLKEELKQELFLILCEMPADRIEVAFNNHYLNYMCINIVKKQYHSSTSPFHKKFRKDKFQELQDVWVDVEAENNEKILSKIEWFLDNKINITDRELFKMYYKMGRYDRWLGDLRDENCQKPISSTRKIEKKLALKEVPGKKRVTIDHSTVSLSIKKTKEKIIEFLKNGNI